jgi:hypothetical protein
MDMDEPLHRIVGIYPDRPAADAARDRIAAAGIARDRIRLLEGASAPLESDAAADSDDVLKDLLRDGAIGTAVGTAAGAGASLALAALNLTLFIASPVLGTLTILGWGAGLGGLVGAVVGSERSAGDVPQLLRDALAAGHVVLVVHARTEDEATQARRVVGELAVPAPATVA